MINELSVNNLVNYKGSIAKVKWICPGNVGDTDGEDFDLLFGNDFGGKLDDCMPIPLTPEILEKAGFENTYEERYSSNGVGLFYTDEGCLLLVEERSNFNFTYQYLHQIQNLYYSLTGEELEIKWQ